MKEKYYLLFELSGFIDSLKYKYHDVNIETMYAQKFLNFKCKFNKKEKYVKSKL